MTLQELKDLALKMGDIKIYEEIEKKWDIAKKIIKYLAHKSEINPDFVCTHEYIDIIEYLIKPDDIKGYNYKVSDLLELKKYILLDIIPYLIYDIQNNKTYCLEELSLKLSMRQLEFLYSCLEFLDKVPRRKWAKIKDYIMFQNQKNN